MIEEGNDPNGPQVNPTTDSTLADPQRIIADLRRELAARTAERDEARSAARDHRGLAGHQLLARQPSFGFRGNPRTSNAPVRGRLRDIDDV
jgi:hypothetical protein